MGRLESNRAIVNARAKAMRSAISRWLRRRAQVAFREAVRNLASQGFRKMEFAKAEAGSTEQLREILEMFGLRQFSDAAGAAASGDVVLHPSAITEFLADKEIKLQQIEEETRRGAEKELQHILDEAERETPRPSLQEITRRIRRQFLDSSVAVTFSDERAELIARTELVMAQNTGAVEGFKASGVEEIQWLAFRDGRSGRGHDDMHGETVAVGQSFELPDGTRMRYPGDPSAPIKHLANCRCSVAPVRRRT